MNTVPKYVPALRWKGAEIEAVRGLDAATKEHIQPLFELVPKDFQTPDKPNAVAPPVEYVIAKNAKLMGDNWGLRAPFFIDFVHLDKVMVPTALEAFDRNASHYGLKAILVTTLTPAVEVMMLRKLNIVKEHGLCIRIDVFEFRQGGFHRALIGLVKNLWLIPGNVDLVIDFGVNPEGPEGIQKILDMIPTAEGDWRSVTVLGGSLPKNLSKLRKNEIHLLQRTEWLGWRRYALAGGTAWFGDYTIQHPIFEDAEGKHFNFSASIRYTSEANTVIVRGEKVQGDDGLGYEQWPANAQILCGLEEHFRGAEFSVGDRFIKEMGEQQAKTGGPKDWLFAGINHHLTLVVYQLTHIEATVDQAISLDADQPDWPARMG